MSNAPIAEGDTLGDKYRIERVLGEGGMGIVVAAWHIELEQRVAIKFLLSELAQKGDAAERFRREARAAVKIRSEHVARVLDVDTTDDGVPYMVMEYLEGRDLAQWIRADGPLEVATAVDLVLEACEALAEAHAAGIVHRDIKPANLFIAERPDGTTAVKVLDFGISKQVLTGDSADLALTKTSALIGSPLYMSPEQMESARTVDARTDIWALGAILHEALTGKPPFYGSSFPHVCAMVLNDDPPPMSEFRSDVPADLEQAVRRCLAKSRDNRFPSVAHFAGAVSQFGSGRSQVSAERAARVLSGSGSVRVSVAASSPNHALEATVPGMSPTENRPATANGSIEVQGTRTEASWGRTGERVERRPIALFGLAAVALALVAAGATYALTRAPAAAALPTSAQSARPIETARAPEAPIEPQPVSAAATALTPAASPTPAPSAAGAADPAASAPARGAPRPGRPHPGPSGPRGPKSPATSDFGGRR